MFVGFADYMISMTDERLCYTVDTHIHHVEQWGSIIKNCNIDDYGTRISDEGMCTDIETLKQTEYYKNMTEWGKNCQRTYVDWKWKSSMYFDILNVDENKAYNIKPESGGDLPFDFSGTGDIDLVVARVNFGAKSNEENEKSSKEITPLDLNTHPMTDYVSTRALFSKLLRCMHCPDMNQIMKMVQDLLRFREIDIMC